MGYWAVDKRKTKDTFPRPPSLLAFFREECKSDFMAIEFITAEGELPLRGNLVAGWYDVSAQYDRVWWQWDFDLDLAAHLDVKECLELLFIPPSFDIFKKSPNIHREWPSLPDARIERWTPSGPRTLWRQHWRRWFWKLMEMQIGVLNNQTDAVKVSLENSSGFTTSEKILRPGELALFKTAVGDKIKFQHQHYRVPYSDRSSPLLKIGSTDNQEPFLSDAEGRRSDEILVKRDQHTSFIESSNVFVPPYLPQFTRGVMLIDMPATLHAKLIQFWEDYSERRTAESFDDSYTVINHFSIPPSLVYLDNNSKRKNDLALTEVKHLISYWSNVPEEELELTSFYGIREYHDGAYLRNHIDRAATHVLSVILQIDQIGVNTRWPVEILDFKGERKTIHMKKGQMLFYESAKMIHGRPRVMHGENFVNAFCHFKPRSGWNYNSRFDSLYDGENFVVDTKLSKLRDEMFKQSASIREH